MQADTLVRETPFEALGAFGPYLASKNEVFRSAAIQAIANDRDLPTDDVRSALLGFLLDEDPDIRCDAMEALTHLARPEDAETIRRSLQGDPVREVKLAAIATLARLQDTNSVPLLRSLALSRSDDQVAWEDEISDWEEWLDVQTASIAALGALQAKEAVDDLITALFDTYGQSVDIPVFKALGQMGDHGVSVLLEIFKETKGAMRRNAASALLELAGDTLRPHLDRLLATDERQLRLLAVKILPKDDPRGAELARNDSDPEIRAEALRQFASITPGLAQACLSDSNEVVKAAAIKGLSAPFDPDFHQAFVDNMLVWLETAGAQLGCAIVEKLVDIAPNRALGPFVQVLKDRSRNLELRIAVAKGLCAPQLKAPLSIIAECLDNPARQVRVALLTGLKVHAAHDAKAIELACQAIDGVLQLSEPDPLPIVGENRPDAGTPKEGSGPSKIWITPDGDIVERDDQTPELSQSRSTLDAILSDPQVAVVPKLAEDTPEETGSKRAKRRAVEGSDDLAGTLALDTLTLFADVDGTLLSEAIIRRTSDPDERMRRAAWTALAKRPVDEDCLEYAALAFKESDPVIRIAALRLLSAHGRVAQLADALSDEDALIRAEGVAALPAASAAGFLSDPASSVRTAAAESILGSGQESLIKAAIETAIDAEKGDTLRLLVSTKAARRIAVEHLSQSTTSNRGALITLRGLL
jgi:HEAT repeat protein